MINDCVGQISTFFQTSTLVSVISDNNPANDTKRVVELQIGNSLHYTKLETSSTTSIGISASYINGSYSIMTSTFNPNNKTCYLMYGSNVFVPRVHGAGYPTSICYVKDTSGNMLCLPAGVGISDIGNNKVYLYNSDDVYTARPATYGYKDTDGKHIVTPMKLLSNVNEIVTTESDYLVATDTRDGWNTGSYLKDSSNVYYYVFYSSYYLIKEG